MFVTYAPMSCDMLCVMCNENSSTNESDRNVVCRFFQSCLINWVRSFCDIDAEEIIVRFNCERSVSTTASTNA